MCQGEKEIKKPLTPSRWDNEGKERRKEEFKDTAEMKSMTTLPFPFPILCVKGSTFYYSEYRMPRNRKYQTNFTQY